MKAYTSLLNGHFKRIAFSFVFFYMSDIGRFRVRLSFFCAICFQCTGIGWDPNKSIVNLIKQIYQFSRLAVTILFRQTPITFLGLTLRLNINRLSRVLRLIIININYTNTTLLFSPLHRKVIDIPICILISLKASTDDFWFKATKWVPNENVDHDCMLRCHTQNYNHIIITAYNKWELFINWRMFYRNIWWIK